MLDGAADGEM
jgi:hypothetical protein